jgi:hypothetical protein
MVKKGGSKKRKVIGMIGMDIDVVHVCVAVTVAAGFTAHQESR